MITAGALTVLALVGGGLVGKIIVSRFKGAAPVVEAPSAPLPYGSDIEVKELPAIVTNLAEPSDHTRAVAGLDRLPEGVGRECSHAHGPGE